MRMFIALDLEKNNLFPLKEKLKNVKGRFVEDKNFHLTLAFLGDVEISMIPKLKEIINSINLDLKELKSTYVSTFHKNVIVLNFEKNKILMDYQKELISLLKENNIYFDNKPYIPHLTLIRNSNEFINFDYKNSFKINSINLFSSTLDKNGAIYDSLFIKNI